jgi:hypothetical protein
MGIVEGCVNVFLDGENLKVMCLYFRECLLALVIV